MSSHAALLLNTLPLSAMLHRLVHSLSLKKYKYMCTYMSMACMQWPPDVDNDARLERERERESQKRKDNEDSRLGAKSTRAWVEIRSGANENK